MEPSFYFAAGSCSLVAHTALEEAAFPYQPVRLDLGAGDQRSARYKAIEPSGRVPALALGSVTLAENLGIIAYLETQRPSLMSQDPIALGRAWQMASWIATTVQPAFAQAFRPERYSPDPSVQTGLAASAVGVLEPLLTRFDAALADGWIGGDIFCPFDAYAVVLRRWAERLKLDVTGLRCWSNHHERVLNRPSIAKALDLERNAAVSSWISAPSSDR